MFESARLKLTAWYLLIIMVVSGLFSLAFYHNSTREIQRLIDRAERDQNVDTNLMMRTPILRTRNLPSIQELRDLKQRSLFTLIIVNGIIFIFSGIAGYFLSGKTLKPIKLMIDEQTQFIANASHELRTPLATLRAEMEGKLLEKKITEKQARALITSNLEELGTLQELTNALLQLTQVHNTNGHDVKQEIALKEILQSAKKKVGSLAKKKEITIDLHLTEATVQGNAKSLTEVFVILLDNAIKYSHGHTTTSVEMTETDSHVHVSIKDQGVGISEADLPFIFNRFYRADKSRSQADGYGIGLAIAKQIIDSHHGKISAKSTLGKGSTFTVQLPIASA